MKEVTRILKALANPRRLAVVKLLSAKGELPVSEISKSIALSFKATSKHMLILHAADVVEKRQEGLNVLYCLTDPSHPFVRAVLKYL